MATDIAWAFLFLVVSPFWFGTVAFNTVKLGRLGWLVANQTFEQKFKRGFDDGSFTKTAGLSHGKD